MIKSVQPSILNACFREQASKANFDDVLLINSAWHTGLFRADMREDNLCFCNKFLPAVCENSCHPAFFAGISECGGIDDLVPWPHIAMRLELGDFRQKHQVLEIVSFSEQNPACLRHPFHDERAGHHWKARKVIVQMLFGQRHILDGLRLLAPVELNELINPKPAHNTYQEEYEF